KINNKGEEITAKKIMLCVGRRGVPRKPGVNGEAKEHIFYSMTEPEVFTGKKVLVVGGGDSAVETACMLAEEGVDVSLSYRSSALSRVKPANREKFEKLVEQNRLKAIFNSNLIEIF
ncbi:MAG: NAD(P)-binding domain-containing protein, partial [Deltaproteobacteria bacterium]|nr:NAD(P)-binding domain-containing protein [Deltaproteobacteria bacterium]